jgi:hypothetical protein
MARIFRWRLESLRRCVDNRQPERKPPVREGRRLFLCGCEENSFTVDTGRNRRWRWRGA